MHLLLAGYGFLGAAIGNLLLRSGNTVTVMRRSKSSPGEGIEFVACDLSVLPPWRERRVFDAVIFSLAPDARDASYYQATYVQAQKNLLPVTQAQRYLFISSTAVYPDSTGNYSEENAAPVSERARLLLEAESVALNHPQAVVLRLAGLYSRERRIYYRAPEPGVGDRLVHFIHRDDAARAVLHALDHSLTGVFNVHDGHPVWRSQILKRLGLIDYELPPGPERRISIAKWQAMGFKPVFSDYFAGIAG